MNKLVLNRETVASLSVEEVADVNGAYVIPASSVCPSWGLPCNQTRLMSICRVCTKVQG